MCATLPDQGPYRAARVREEAASLRWHMMISRRIGAVERCGGGGDCAASRQGTTLQTHDMQACVS
jgi:hypothetical protein